MEAWSDVMKYRLGTWNDWEFGRSRATLDIHNWSVSKGKFTQMLTRPGYHCLRALESPAVRRVPQSTMSSFPSAENIGILNIVLILLMKKSSTRSGTVFVDLGLAFHPWSPWAARVECWLGASGKTWKLGSEKRRDLGKLRCQVECLRLETSRKVAQQFHVIDQWWHV